MATERRIEERAAELERNALPPASSSPIAPDVKAALAAADAAFSGGDLASARAGYAALVEVPALDRASALHLGEALYESGDYRNAVRAYQRAGTFRPGEEPHRYTFALALYETGSYRAAKRELAAALPKLEQTAEVARNRAKIEGAIE
jgi:tetratricopeptide (TPR) repeat protein